jgi:hypothetical protein
VEKDEILQTIDESNVSLSEKSLLKTAVNSAYDAGFREGMKRGSEVMSKTFEMLYNRPQKAST